MVMRRIMRAIAGVGRQLASRARRRKPGAQICGCCGKQHDDLSPYFMMRVPDAALARRDELVFDDRFTCRLGDELHFISCELEVPFKSDDLTPLGFICWAAVDRKTYDAYRAYRAKEEDVPACSDLVRGRLANPIPGIDDSCGTLIGFKVLRADPTPYIRWVEPSSSVAALLERGASVEYWHAVAGLI